MKIIKIYSKRSATVYEYDVDKGDIEMISKDMALTEDQCKNLLSMMEDKLCTYVRTEGGNNKKSIIIGKGSEALEYHGGPLFPDSNATAIAETEDAENPTDTEAYSDATDIPDESYKGEESVPEEVEKPKKVKKTFLK